MIAVDISKQQALDANHRATQQTNFTANIDQAGNTTSFLIIKEAKNCFGLFTRNCKSIVNVLYNNLTLSNIISI